MDRREMLERLGFVAVGVAACGSASADHGGDAKHESKFMDPVQSIHAHFCGIHIAKKNPSFQLIAQHYCAPRSEEMHQCLLYESYEKNAKLLGVEYIVTDKVFRELPDEEKKYWHPHTYEVLAGGLIAPGMKQDDETKFMKALLTTWGKTWHTWPDPTTNVPLGEPLLMWAVTGDGQLNKEIAAARDKQFGVSMDEIRERRCKHIGYEVPKVGSPNSIETIGRQWTDSGEDRPVKRGGE
jgi:hypothetical protein